MHGVLNNLVAIFNLLLWIAVPAALLWFLYRAFFRKMWRLRKIAVIRSKRELREAAERELHPRQ